MTSSCILGSIPVEKNRKLELLCFYSICLKFGMVGNFEMLITKRRPKSTNFWPKLSQALFNNSVSMAIVDVLCDWLVFKMEAY